MSPYLGFPAHVKARGTRPSPAPQIRWHLIITHSFIAWTSVIQREDDSGCYLITLTQEQTSRRLWTPKAPLHYTHLLDQLPHQFQLKLHVSCHFCHLCALCSCRPTLLLNSLVDLFPHFHALVLSPPLLRFYSLLSGLRPLAGVPDACVEDFILFN